MLLIWGVIYTRQQSVDIFSYIGRRVIGTDLVFCFEDGPATRNYTFYRWNRTSFSVHRVQKRWNEALDERKYLKTLTNVFCVDFSHILLQVSRKKFFERPLVTLLRAER